MNILTNNSFIYSNVGYYIGSIYTYVKNLYLESKNK